MKAGLKFIKKHWLTLSLLIASIVGVNWIVTHKRAPGSMTVIEAQGMDMTSMKPPTGTMPVSVETARSRQLSGGTSFPATISAMTEEEIVARIPGRLSRVLVYPGDKVTAGQLVATIDAPEYAAGVKKAEAMSGAKSSEVLSAERETAHHRNVLLGAKAKVSAAESAQSRAKTEVEAARIEVEKAKEDLDGVKASKIEQQAQLTFAEKELVRQQALYKKGAISLEELQGSQKERDAAAARVQNADAAIRSSAKTVQIAEKRFEVAQKMASEAEINISVAKAEALQAEEGIAQAHADASAKRFEASAANADVTGAAVLSDYSQLRSLGGGVVSERLVSPGTAVTAGQVVLRLRTVSQVRVQSEIPQSLSGTIKPGTMVRIVTDAGEREAKITSVFPTVDPSTRTFRVEAMLANPDGSLKPGMFAHMELLGPGDGVLAVKSAAIQTDDSGKFVWTVGQKPGTGKSDWTCTMHPEVSMPGPGKCPKCGMDLTLREKSGSNIAHRTPVTIGKEGSGYTAISKGLHDGDKVIWAGFENLIEGTPVDIGADNGKKEMPMNMDMGGGK